MDRDGITVRGLDGIPGPHHLNEVFLDDVWVSRSEVLGEVGNGWQVIRDALSNERVGIARYARGDRLLATVIADDEYRAVLSPSRLAPRPCAEPHGPADVPAGIVVPARRRLATTSSSPPLG